MVAHPAPPSSAPRQPHASAMSTALLAPLRNPAYRAIWVATLLSNFGVWIQMVAAAWLMTSIAPTVDFVAWVQAATALPPLVFTLVGGVLADRIDQRLIFLVAQLIVLVVALLLSVIDGFGLMTPWLLLGLTFALDSGSALRYRPTRPPSWRSCRGRKLASALMLASVGWNIARAAGPGIGGLIIAVLGVPAAFAANALCNVLIVVVLVRQRRQSAIVKAKSTAGLLSEILGGFRHVWAAPAIRWAMLRCLPVHAVRQRAVVAAAAGRQAAGGHRLELRPDAGRARPRCAGRRLA